MALSKSKNPYFIAEPSVVLRNGPGTGSKINHLILGDWLNYLGETRNGWVKVRCRGDTGWVKEVDVSAKRALEVNFVDIGQGDGCHIVTPEDDVILIDAGVGSNMNRFLSWRYNLRRRNVKRAPDFDPAKEEKEPWQIDHVVISHPDNDHYYGLLDVFENPKLKFKNIYHNGIVERPIEEKDPKLTYPSRDDLGGYAKDEKGRLFVWNVVDTSKRMKDLVDAHPTTRKQYISTMRALLKNTRGVTITALNKDMDDLGREITMGPFDGSQSLKLEVLGPIREKISHDGETRSCLRKLGNEGVTKNGHSVILKLTCSKLTVMLGGDLNTQSQDFLLKSFTSGRTNASLLEKKIAKLEAKGTARDVDDEKALAAANAILDALVAEARPTFECDVTKACHHGSAHFSDTFLRTINPVVTVISSGDEESHSHPRPDALGTFGKHGRGRRPLIFSTELARSTREFTPVIKFLEEIRRFEAELAAETDPKERKKIEERMQARRDRNVAVYGMITMRSLGDVVILAQKLEKPRSQDKKWDIYELHHNANTGTFEYRGH